MPIVGIPVFGDQPGNVMKAVHRGLGLVILFLPTGHHDGGGAADPNSQIC